VANDQSYEEKRSAISDRNKRFLESVKERVSQWKKTHPRLRPPIYADKEGVLHWVSRKERRIQQSNKYKNKLAK